jgi:hypothetical protein
MEERSERQRRERDRERFNPFVPLFAELLNTCGWSDDKRGGTPLRHLSLGHPVSSSAVALFSPRSLGITEKNC